MKRILFFLVSVFSYAFGFSQSEKEIHGKILSGQTALANIDIVNINSKKSSTTDSNGRFSILAKTDDELFIISKEYVDQKIVLSQTEIDKNNLVIYLEKRAIELHEVTVTNLPSMKIEVTQADIDGIKIAKEARALKPLNVYDGTIPNGFDFIRLGKGIANLFKDKDKAKAKKPLPSIEFKDYIRATFSDDFLVQKLNLKPEEVMLFISFCEADPKANTVSAAQDYFETMDFLISKNEAFKKLNSTNK